MSLFGELRRRNVFRVAIAYSVVAWLLAQVAELALDSFGSPEWVMKTLLLLLAIGLPIAVIFAWAFELTPEGVKREKEVDRSQSITHRTGRKIDFVIIGVLVAALVFAVVTYEWNGGSTETVAAKSAQTATENDQSIAVLPFINMSDDAGNEYFSDGISEELLNVLVRVKGLRVASRTSSFAFKGKDTSIPNIAESLGVAHVLEGSVRKAGDTVRVTAQLIDARTDTHLWSATYDRKLEDIFAIQDEISGHIVDALKIALGTDAQQSPSLVKQPTENLEAYQDYLRGRYLWQRRGGENIANAIELFEQATSQDPGFARAWSSLAAAHITLPTYAEVPGEIHYPLAYEYARKALTLDPTLAEAYAVLAEISRGSRKWGEAEELYRQAIKNEPKNPTAYLWYSEHLLCLGRNKAALEMGLMAYQLDPLHPGTNQVLGEIYESLGDYKNLEKHARIAYDLGHVGGLLALIQKRLAEKQFDDARPLSEEFATKLNTNGVFLRSRIDAFAGPAAVQAYLDLLLVTPPRFGPLQYLADYIRLGHIDEAFGLITSPDLFHGNSWFDLWRTDTAAFRRDPRFEALVTSAGFVEYWNQYGWPPACKQTDGKIVCQ